MKRFCIHFPARMVAIDADDILLNTDDGRLVAKVSEETIAQFNQGWLYWALLKPKADV